MPAATFPEPELYATGSGEPALRWGLIGPGGIASPFVEAVHRFTDQRFTAVSSRALPRATAFAAQHGIPAAVGSRAELVARDDVDVVYIASPPGAHLEDGLAALDAGKHVLIEKPLAASAADARILVERARAAGVLLMEAMWARYLPQASVIRRLLADGALGEIRILHAHHGQAIDPAPDHRLSRPELGGGALLDLGIYPVQFDAMVLGPPTALTATGRITATGVDDAVTIVAEHPGALSTLTASMTARTINSAVVAGSAASLELAPFFFTPTELLLRPTDPDAEVARWTDPTGREGFLGLSWEATALARFVGEGRLESPVHPLDETVRILAVLDEAREQIRARAERMRE